MLVHKLSNYFLEAIVQAVITAVPVQKTVNDPYYNATPIINSRMYGYCDVIEQTHIINT